MRHKFLWECVEAAVILAVVSVAGCVLLGPSDSQIQQAESYAASLPEGHPDKAAAEARVARLKADRASADELAGVIVSAAGYAVPGLGGLLAVAYGITQKLRRRKDRAALTATMEAIEQFKNSGGDEAVRVLVEELATRHDRAGVRDAVRKALAELKLSKGKAA